jgi:hypothetical protein
VAGPVIGPLSTSDSTSIRSTKPLHEVFIHFKTPVNTPFSGASNAPPATAWQPSEKPGLSSIHTIGQSTQMASNPSADCLHVRPCTSVQVVLSLCYVSLRIQAPAHCCCVTLWLRQSWTK